jgi:hypothetical protein
MSTTTTNTTTRRQQQQQHPNRSTTNEDFAHSLYALAESCLPSTSLVSNNNSSSNTNSSSGWMKNPLSAAQRMIDLTKRAYIKSSITTTTTTTNNNKSSTTKSGHQLPSIQLKHLWKRFSQAKPTLTLNEAKRLICGDRRLKRPGLVQLAGLTTTDPQLPIVALLFLDYLMFSDDLLQQTRDVILDAFVSLGLEKIASELHLDIHAVNPTTRNACFRIVLGVAGDSTEKSRTLLGNDRAALDLFIAWLHEDDEESVGSNNNNNMGGGASSTQDDGTGGLPKTWDEIDFLDGVSEDDGDSDSDSEREDSDSITSSKSKQQQQQLNNSTSIKSIGSSSSITGGTDNFSENQHITTTSFSSTSHHHLKHRPPTSANIDEIMRTRYRSATHADLTRVVAQTDKERLNRDGRKHALVRDRLSDIVRCREAVEIFRSKSSEGDLVLRRTRDTVESSKILIERILQPVIRKYDQEQELIKARDVMKQFEFLNRVPQLIQSAAERGEWETAIDLIVRYGPGCCTTTNTTTNVSTDNTQLMNFLTELKQRFEISIGTLLQKMDYEIAFRFSSPALRDAWMNELTHVPGLNNKLLLSTKQQTLVVQSNPTTSLLELNNTSNIIQTFMEAKRNILTLLSIPSATTTSTGDTTTIPPIKLSAILAIETLKLLELNELVQTTYDEFICKHVIQVLLEKQSSSSSTTTTTSQQLTYIPSSHQQFQLTLPPFITSICNIKKDVDEFLKSNQSNNNTTTNNNTIANSDILFDISPTLLPCWFSWNTLFWDFIVKYCRKNDDVREMAIRAIQHAKEEVITTLDGCTRLIPEMELDVLLPLPTELTNNSNPNDHLTCPLLQKMWLRIVQLYDHILNRMENNNTNNSNILSSSSSSSWTLKASRFFSVALGRIAEQVKLKSKDPTRGFLLLVNDCRFFKNRVEFLTRGISEDGVELKGQLERLEVALAGQFIKSAGTVIGETVLDALAGFRDPLSGFRTMRLLLLSTNDTDRRCVSLIWIRCMLYIIQYASECEIIIGTRFSTRFKTTMFKTIVLRIKSALDSNTSTIALMMDSNQQQQLQPQGDVHLLQRRRKFWKQLFIDILYVKGVMVGNNTNSDDADFNYVIKTIREKCISLLGNEWDGMVETNLVMDALKKHDLYLKLCLLGA